jgi:hypothetical protein
MALTIVTNPVTPIGTTTATCGGNSITTPTGTITAKGVCWGITTNPFLTKTSVSWSKSGNTATITSSAHGMSSGTIITISVSTDATAVPNTNYVITVTNANTFTITLSTSSTATGTFSYNIVGNGFTNDGTGNSNFPSAITSLTTGTTYYVRAYVTELVGSTSTTYYGANVVFTTLGLTTTAATSITSTTAISGATAVNGFTSISAVGICWNTVTAPTTSNNKTIDILTGNFFISSMTGLLPGVLYYIRSYVISGGTTYYGNEISFTTTASSPIVTTTSPVSITSTTADPNGNVSNIGGTSLNITKRGVCYSTSSTGIDITVSPTGFTPQVSQTGTYGTGPFTIGSITGLTPATTYYYRAYAINNSGAGLFAYGEQKNFTTLGGPLVETVIPYSITSSTAQVGCNILSIGGSALIARGVVISTSPGPTLSTGSVFSDLYPGNGTQYLTKLTSLTKDTTYYIRAYATNTQGTSYGEELIFSTTSCNPLVEDCNPQQEPPVICSEPGCEYIIPLECVVGDIPTSSVSCSNISLTPDENTLLSELQKINEVLCTLSSRDFIIFYLTSIYNSDVLKTIFCDVKTRCTTIDATVLADSGTSIISITAITPTTYVLIGRTITCGTGGKFTALTKITGFVSGVNGGVGVYTISSPMLAAYTGPITLTFG